MVSRVASRTEQAEQKRRGEIEPGIGAATTRRRLRKSRAQSTNSLATDTQVFRFGSGPPSFRDAGGARTRQTLPEQRSFLSDILHSISNSPFPNPKTR